MEGTAIASPPQSPQMGGSAPSEAQKRQMRKDKFVKDTTPRKKWVQDMPHPLYDYCRYNDMSGIAKMVKVTPTYVREVLKGYRSWEPADNKRGDKKRSIIWKATDYLFSLIEQGVIDKYPKPKAKKGERKNPLCPPEGGRRNG